MTRKVAFALSRTANPKRVCPDKVQVTGRAESPAVPTHVASIVAAVLMKDETIVCDVCVRMKKI